MARKRNSKTTDPVVKDLDAIKRLLVLLLIKAGTKQGEIAMALDVEQSVVSRMFPARNVEAFPRQS